ncbi:hypothetical protein H4R33_001166 [Dimargaris cristalligena]|nr:hypothetical protein H4R33_001166 [Dimargaris cristalligena]
MTTIDSMTALQHHRNHQYVGHSSRLSPDEHANYPLIRAIVYPILAVSLALGISLNALFIIRGHNNPFYEKRSISLSTIGNIASIISLVASALYYAEDFPCLVIYLSNVVTVHLTLTIPLLCTLKLLALAKHAQVLGHQLNFTDQNRMNSAQTGGQAGNGSASERSVSISRLSQPSVTLQRTWRRPWYIMGQRSLKFKLMAITAALVIYTCIVYSVFVATQQDRSLSHGNPGCSLGWLSAYNTAVAGAILIIIYIPTLFFLRHLDDGFGIRQELTIYYFGLFVLELAYRIVYSLDLPRPNSGIALLIISYAQYIWYTLMFLILPLYKGHIQRIKMSRARQMMPANRQTLFRIINHPDKYFDFRRFCTSIYCGELPTFLLDYQILKLALYEVVLTERRTEKEKEEEVVPHPPERERKIPPVPKHENAHGSAHQHCHTVSMAAEIFDSELLHYSISSTSGSATRPVSHEYNTSSSSALSHGGGSNAASDLALVVAPFEAIQPPSPTPSNPLNLPSSDPSAKPGASAGWAKNNAPVPPLAEPHPPPFNPVLPHLTSTQLPGAIQATVVERDLWARLVRDIPYPASISSVWPHSLDDPVPDHLRGAFRHFYTKYISAESIFEINIDIRKKKPLQDQVAHQERYTVGMFEEVKDAVIDLLVTDTLARYNADYSAPPTLAESEA